MRKLNHIDMKKASRSSTETLNYIRVATEKIDGSAGVLYLHSWGTGHQEYIFSNHAEAQLYADSFRSEETEVIVDKLDDSKSPE